MHAPRISGASIETRLLSRLPRVDRLFSPQYSRMAQATSSKMRLIFFLFSSKEIPPFPRIYVPYRENIVGLL